MTARPVTVEVPGWAVIHIDGAEAILGIPGLAIVWFFAVAELSGTLGNPF